MVRIHQVLTTLPGLYSTLDSYTGHLAEHVQSTFTSPMHDIMDSLERLREMVETTIDLEAADRHEYLIKSDFHPELSKIRQKMDDAQSKMQPEAEKVH